MLIKDGVLSPEELQSILPDPERLAKGPVAIIECLQDIPCDPCVAACPVHAISMQTGITDRPRLDQNTCTGCGVCIASCPGLAIFVVNTSAAGATATISLSYELLPLPAVGEMVTALDRTGKPVCEAKVTRVINIKKYDHTYVVTLEIPRESVMEVRAIRCNKGGRK